MFLDHYIVYIHGHEFEGWVLQLIKGGMLGGMHMFVRLFEYMFVGLDMLCIPIVFALPVFRYAIHIMFSQN